MIIQALFYYNIIMKDEYRKRYLEIRKNIKNREIKNDVIYNKIINNKNINNAKLLLIYVSTKYEVDTIKIIKYFLNRKLIAVPKIENGMMNFYYINSLDDLKVGYFNILEPINGKLVTNFNDALSITPGICFSYDFNRIGYGKGYYDNFYSKHIDIYKVGLCYKELLLDSVPCDEFDIKVDEIITN